MPDSTISGAVTGEQVLRRGLSRREVIKRSAAFGLSLPAVASLLAACGGDDEEDPGTGGDEGGDETEEETEESSTEDEGSSGDEDSVEETPESDEGDTASEGEAQRGGTLEVALIGEPPTLDIHQTTATIVALTTWHMYEPLFTWDAEFQVMPELAESYEVSDDGMTVTLTLLDGVTFHNGDPMTSADVVASIERWASISGLGENLINLVDQINQVDDLTIEFLMVEPYGAFAVALARQNQGCGIYPQSVVEAAGTDPLDEFIGTGPYQFVERQADRFIRLERFDDYVQRGDEPNGYGGAKNQYLDVIMFHPVPNESSRISGLQAGDYHYLESIIPDQVETLEGNPDVQVEVLPPSSWETLVLNTDSGILSDLTLRQAVQATLNHEPILISGLGEDFYRLDPSIMLQETAWHSTVGEELYNPNDPERAQQLMEEAGYDGAPIRLMTTQEYQDQYNQAVIAQQQLEDVGFTIELEVYDWATLTERRNEPANWDIFTTGISFRVDPIQLPMLQGTSWPGWWDTEDKVAATAEMAQQPEFEDRYAAFEEIQRLFYEQVPMIKIGDSRSVSARAPMLKNFITPTQLQPSFWNVWLEQ